MAIDAVIIAVKQDNNDLILTLGKRIYKDGGGKWGSSIPGQPELRILNFTYRPLIGQFIWGGSDTARAVANVPNSQAQEYRRLASGALRETR